MTFDHSPSLHVACNVLSCLFTFCFAHIDTCEMPTWHLARGGIKKSIARVQAHFSSPHSSRRLRRFSVLCRLWPWYPTQTSEPARRLPATFFFNLSRNIVALQVETQCCTYYFVCAPLISQQNTVASWGNMLRKVDSRSSFRNKF